MDGQQEYEGSCTQVMVRVAASSVSEVRVPTVESLPFGPDRGSKHQRSYWRLLEIKQYTTYSRRYPESARLSKMV